jgi:regulator of protease activity HflC (stomatin/prohibitin superfamily)
MTALIALAIFLLLIVPSMVRIVREYERGVVFRLGRLVGARGPGLILLIPFIDRMVKVDLRVVTMDVPRQEMMTRDNVPVTVDAVVYFRVVNPEDAIVKVEDFVRATALYAQTTLRSVVGQHELDDLLSRRDQVNAQLQRIIDDATEPWGIKVTAVEVRERRAKIINAEGEFQAAERLVEAARKMAEQPIALQLRYLQTLAEIASEQNSTTIFPLPIDLVRPFLGRDARGG